MFFLISKIIGVLLNPIVWISVFLIGAIFTKRAILKSRLLLTGVVLFIFFSNSFVINKIIGKWELSPLNDTQYDSVYSYGIVLSGMAWYDSESEQVNFLQSSDRIWHAVRLYKQGRIKKIFISGGDAGILKKEIPESILLRNFLISIGIPSIDIETDEFSRNTRENALYTFQKIQKNNKESFLLITSALHMRRADLCFKKVGLTCDKYPTDRYSGKNKQSPLDIIIPSEQALQNWNVFIHELIGMISYKLMGYI